MAEEICPDEGPDAEKFQFIEFDDCATLDALGPEYGDPIVIDNCEGFEAFEADTDRYQIVEIVSTESMECACCGCECCGCNGYWTEYTLTASGFANNGVNPCNDCTDHNGSFTLHHRGGCSWDTDEPSEMVFCGGGEGPLWSLICQGGVWAASTQELGCGTGLYQPSGGNLCSCGGAIALDPVGVTTCLSCSAWAASVTIEPAGEWVNCGAGSEGPACGALMAARAAMTPEQKAVLGAAQTAVREMYAARKGGPGTEMKKLLGELGFSATAGCGCDKMAANMNAWGVEGCSEHREEILAWLRGQQAKAGRLAKAKAGARAVRSGVAFKLNPLDPAPGLLDEAIRRAARQRAGSSDSATGTPDTSK